MTLLSVPEEKTLTFTGADIAKQGICEECEKPAKIGNPGAAHFAKGQVYQMLFKLPLGCDAAAGGSSSQECKPAVSFLRCGC